MSLRRYVVGLLAFGAVLSTVLAADDFASQVADRAAVERVYFSHRLGGHETFEQALPKTALESLVRLDRDKEAVLKKVYGMTVTEGMVDAEARRIDASTRAPAVLTELKSALGNDPTRFARAVARPIVVDRLLREHFDNDKSLHSAARQEMEQVRDKLLTAKASGVGAEELVARLSDGHSNEVMESTWLLTPRPVPTASGKPDEAEINRRFGPEARVVSSPENPTGDNNLYISDMPPDLRRVLLVQLARAGDISGVIEAEGGFLVYLARVRTATNLDLACLTLRKRDFDGWLREQCAKLKE